MMSSGAPPIAFLGAVERAALVRDGNTNLFKYNLIGLKHTVLSHLFPLSFSELHYALAIYAPEDGTQLKLRVKNEAGNEVGKIDIALQYLATPEPTIEDVAIKRGGQTIAIPLEGWAFMVIPPSRSTAMIPKPGLYTLTVDTEGQEVAVGQLLFALIDPEPLSASRIAAIRSNPSAVKAVRAEIRCDACGDAMKTYAGLEHIPEGEVEGYTWYENLPDSFTCSCKRANFDLSIYRRNLHGLLGGSFNHSGEIAFLPLYEKGGLSGRPNTHI
jgi:hypothetical protein